MMDFIRGVFVVALGLAGMVVIFALHLIPWLLSIYFGIWLLDYFDFTNIL